MFLAVSAFFAFAAIAPSLGWGTVGEMLNGESAAQGSGGGCVQVESSRPIALATAWFHFNP
jgi:hypothetical protein